MLSPRHYQAILELIECVYAAPTKTLLLPIFLEKLKIIGVTSASRLLNTECGCDFYSVFDKLLATPGAAGGWFGAMEHHRQHLDHAFTERDRTVMDIVLPHLSHALHAHELREALAAASGVGLIVIGTDGHPTLVNDEARRVLDGRSMETIPDPGLGADSVEYQTKAGSYRVRTLSVPGGAERRSSC